MRTEDRRIGDNGMNLGPFFCATTWDFAWKLDTQKKKWFIKHHVHHRLHHHNNHCHHHDHSLPSKPAMVGHVRNFWSPSWNSPFAYGCICTYVCLMCMSTSLSPCLSVSAGNCMTACHVCMPVCIHSMPSIPLFPWTNNLIYCREASGNHS